MEEPTVPTTKRKSPEIEEAAPLMKRQAKAATPTPSQKTAAAKAPIAKVPPAGKAPITKAPIAKVPPAGKAPITKAPIAKRPPTATVDIANGMSFAKKPPATPAQSPPPSPGSPVSPDGEAPSLSRQGSWQDFTEVDPLYALLGELSENKPLNGDGEIDEEKMRNYITRAMRPHVKPKNWIEIWAAMSIPVEINSHSLVVRMILEIGVGSEVGDTIGEVLAELVKGHRAKVKAVEEAVVTLFECGCDEKDCIARFLLLLFPKSPTTEFGWSRVGWSWREWWSMAQKIFGTLEKSAAFEALRTLLSSIESESGTYLPHQQIWDEKRLEIIRSALCHYGDLQEDELGAAIDVSLS